ncbi:DUF1444 family protein [Aquimarina algicola]|uniref:DUF1444 family protein n=1 Tax=Aquimarina algicola TaxID=2589995 RepID=A0A504JJG7_9FLAO|nr:DUF1444 family protein [Aquimarina algicola]TPN86899.1 DUF1444 family protein [Aquimarina algicola]
MDKLLPILKTSDYKKDEKLLFKEYLFESEISPIVAYGKDRGRMVMYESATDENDFNLKFPKLKEEALSNLKSIDVHYQITDAEGTKILFAEGNEYASEKILDKDFMMKIASELNSQSLMVGIPFKGLLIAIDANSPMRLKLPVIVKQYFDNPQQDKISDKVFMVQNGEIVAIGGEKIPKTNDSDSFSFSEDKNQNYSIELNSNSIDRLTEDVNISFQQVLLMIMQKKSFGGQITFKLNDNINLDTKLVDKCHSYISQIEKNEMLQVLSQTLANSKVNFKFLHNGELIAPKTSNSTEVEKTDNSEMSNEKNKKRWWEFWK